MRSGGRVGARGQRGDPPAGRGRARPLALGHCFLGIAPAPQQEGGDAGALGSELQAAAGDHRQAPHFAGHRGEAGRAQPFFHRPQDLVVALGEQNHEAGRVEPVLGQSRPVQIRPLQAPQHHALTRLAPSGLATLSRGAGEGYDGACLSPLPQCGRGGTGRASGRWVRGKAGEDAGNKTGSGGAVLLVAIHPKDLMHRAPREAAARQRAVDLGNIEGQDAMPCRRLDMPNLLAQRIQMRKTHLLACFCRKNAGAQMSDPSAGRGHFVLVCRDQNNIVLYMFNVICGCQPGAVCR